MKKVLDSCAWPPRTRTIYIVKVLGLMKRRRFIGVVFPLLFAALAVVTVVVFVFVLQHPPRQTFTEFYVLDAQGKAIDYPLATVIGEPLTVRLGIANHEQMTQTYLIDTLLNGTATEQLGPVVLEDGAALDEPVNVIFTTIGERQRADFLLYRQGQDGVYRSVHLLVTVTD